MCGMNEARICPYCGSVNYVLLRNGLIECSKCMKQDWLRWSDLGPEGDKIWNPLSLGDKPQKISAVLTILASQGECDGTPYDQMIQAANYIDELEKRIREIESK